MLSTQLGEVEKQTGNIPSRARYTGDETCLNWVDFQVDPYDGYRLCRMFGGRDRPGGPRKNRIDLKLGKVNRERREKLRSVMSRPMLEKDVLALDIARLA
jgi:hypothetical protein